MKGTLLQARSIVALVPADRTMRRLAILVLAIGAMALPGGVAGAQGLEIGDCDYRTPSATCGASLSVDRDTNTYVVGVEAQCAKVDVQIDGTVYEHKLPNGGSVRDSVMVFQKGKDYQVSIGACKIYPTKQARLEACLPVMRDAIAPCRAQRISMTDSCRARSQAGEIDMASCWRQVQDATQGCYEQGAEAGNACLGERGFALLRKPDYIGVTSQPY